VTPIGGSLRIPKVQQNTKPKPILSKTSKQSLLNFKTIILEAQNRDSMTSNRYVLTSKLLLFKVRELIMT
jgi:hypothetical protein